MPPDMDLFLGMDFRIDVLVRSVAALTNITGFEAKEDFGFTAEPAVRTGKVVKVLGL